MRLLLFGATGKVGRLVVDEALRRGHQVSAFVHTTTPRQADVAIIRGDVYNHAAVAAAVAERPDAIISTLGSWGTHRKDVVSNAARAIIPAAQQYGISRIVSLTGNLAYAPEDKHSYGRAIAHGVGGVFMSKILYDGEEHITALAESTLDWTVLRAALMTDRAAAGYTLTDTSASLWISRKAVASAMIDVIEKNTWLRQAPYIRQA